MHTNATNSAELARAVASPIVSSGTRRETRSQNANPPRALVATTDRATTEIIEMPCHDRAAATDAGVVSAVMSRTANGQVRRDTLRRARTTCTTIPIESRTGLMRDPGTAVHRTGTS